MGSTTSEDSVCDGCVGSGVDVRHGRRQTIALSEAGDSSCATACGSGCACAGSGGLEVARHRPERPNAKIHPLLADAAEDDPRPEEDEDGEEETKRRAESPSRPLAHPFDRLSREYHHEVDPLAVRFGARSIHSTQKESSAQASLSRAAPDAPAGGATPLARSLELLTAAVRTGDFPCLVDLVASGHNMSVKDKSGHSLLMVAAASAGGEAKTAVLEFLLDAAANLEARDVTGRTAMHFACLNDNIEVLRFLLAQRADANSGSVKGATPLMTAVKEKAKDHMLMLLKSKARVDQADRDGWTSLFHACQLGLTGMARKLLYFKADLSRLSQDGTTPLLISSQVGDIRTAELLLRSKADLDRKNFAGAFPLSISIINGNAKFSMWLIDMACAVDEQDGDGNTPDQLAKDYGQTSIKNRILNINRKAEEAERARALLLLSGMQGVDLAGGGGDPTSDPSSPGSPT